MTSFLSNFSTLYMNDVELDDVMPYTMSRLPPRGRTIASGPPSTDRNQLGNHRQSLCIDKTRPPHQEPSRKTTPSLLTPRWKMVKTSNNGDMSRKHVRLTGHRALEHHFRSDTDNVEDSWNWPHAVQDSENPPRNDVNKCVSKTRLEILKSMSHRSTKFNKDKLCLRSSSYSINSPHYTSPASGRLTSSIPVHWLLWRMFPKRSEVIWEVGVVEYVPTETWVLTARGRCHQPSKFKTCTPAPRPTEIQNLKRLDSMSVNTSFLEI